MDINAQYRVPYIPRNAKVERKYTVGYCYEKNCRKAKRNRIIDKVLVGLIIVLVLAIVACLVNDFVIQPRIREAEFQQDMRDRQMLDRLLTSYRDGVHHHLRKGETLPGISKLMYYQLSEYNGVEYVVMATYSGWIYAGPVSEYTYLNGIQLLDQHQCNQWLRCRYQGRLWPAL